MTNSVVFLKKRRKSCEFYCVITSSSSSWSLLSNRPDRNHAVDILDTHRPIFYMFSFCKVSFSQQKIFSLEPTPPAVWFFFVDKKNDQNIAKIATFLFWLNVSQLNKQSWIQKPDKVIFNYCQEKTIQPSNEGSFGKAVSTWEKTQLSVVFDTSFFVLMSFRHCSNVCYF